MTVESRVYSSWISEEVKLHLKDLLTNALKKDVGAYRETMIALGDDLGSHIEHSLPKTGDVLFVTTVEDADYLAKGVLDSLKLRDRTKVFCYWNERDKKLDTAPILSKYEEPLEKGISAVVILKSVISGACVVRTNLTEALDKTSDSVPIFVLAPVMHKDAERKLSAEFPKNISKRFIYITCATDSEKNGEDIRPGIGGSIYELLGYDDKVQKNKSMPELIKKRSLDLYGQKLG